MKHSRFQYCYECTPLCHSSGSASPVHLLRLQVWDRPQQDVRAELTAYWDKDCYTSSKKLQVMNWLTRMVRWNRLANYIIYWRACPQSTRVIIYTPGPVSADSGILTTHRCHRHKLCMSSIKMWHLEWSYKPQWRYIWTLKDVFGCYEHNCLYATDKSKPFLPQILTE